MRFNDFIQWACGHLANNIIIPNMKQNKNKMDKRLLKYEHFKICTLSPAHSLICMTSSPKTIGHIFGPWAIFVPNMTWIQCIVLEISCLQAWRHTHTPMTYCSPLYYVTSCKTKTHPYRRVLILQPMTLIVILLCIAHPNLTYTITSPIVLQLVTHCMHCIVQLVTWNSIVHVTGCKTKTHPYIHTSIHTHIHTHTRHHDRIGSWCYRIGTKKVTK